MSRRLLAISAVLATLGAFSAPAFAADAAKPDVHGLYLMTDYPAISVQAGTTSTVSLHLHNYGLPVQGDTLDYMAAVMALPAWREWYDAAMRETWIMQHNEPEWPLVRGVAVE